MTLRPLLALVLFSLSAPAIALEPVDHPDPDSLTGSVATVIRDARGVFEAARSSGTPTGEDWGTLGMVYHAHEFNIPAAQAYRNAAEAAPGDYRWHHLLGLFAWQAGEFEEAIGHFDRSLASSEAGSARYTPSAVLRLRSLEQLGRQDEAERGFRELAAEDVAAAWVGLGELLLARGEYAEAAGALERGLELQPQADQVYYPLAMAYRGLRDADRAREALGKAGAKDIGMSDTVMEAVYSYSGSASYYTGLGLAALRNGHYQSALGLLERALEADPERHLARIHYARMLEATGEPQRALAELQRVVAAEPDNALARFHLGAIHEVLGADDAALPHYLRAVEAQRGYFQVELLLANLYMRRGQWADGAEHYRRAREARPERSGLLFRRAFALWEAGRCSASLDALFELVQLVPEDFEVLIAYSRVAASCPDVAPIHRSNALNAARNMYRMSPELPVVETLALAEAGSGNFDLAVQYASQALFMAQRDGLEGQIPTLRAALDAYGRDSLPERPWPADHPLLHPRPLKLSDRYQNGP